MPAVILAASEDWTCQFCWYTEQTPKLALAPGEVATRFHPCPAQGGLTTPLKPAGVRCEVRPVQRGDYVGAELVQRGRQGQTPMAFETIRDDGNDVAVLAACATAELRAG